MLAVDTSGSMTECLPQGGQNEDTNDNTCNGDSVSTACGSATNDCGFPDTRLDGAKCALGQTIQAFSGLVNFGMAGFAGTLSNCPS
jgi:hypothetical protein